MSAEPLALFEGKRYINLTTFRKSGIAVPTPVWFVVHEGRLYVFTAAQSGKAKRIRANGRALVAPSDARGHPLGEFVPARARPVGEPELIRRLEQAFQKKYTWQRRLLSLFSRWARRRAGKPILIELELLVDGASETTQGGNP